MARDLSQIADSQVVKYLQDVVAWTRTFTFSALVRAVYARYPEYRVNSVFSG